MRELLPTIQIILMIIFAAAYAGPATYSCLTVLPNGEIACFYEGGEKNPYESMIFEKFSIRWLTEQ